LTANDTLIYSCAPPPTVFLHVTEYVPVYTTETTTASYFTTDTDTTTATITTTTPTTIVVYQTIIETTILTLVGRLAQLW
jgi:hypothetical protein